MYKKVVGFVLGASAALALGGAPDMSDEFTDSPEQMEMIQQPETREEIVDLEHQHEEVPKGLGRVVACSMQAEINFERFLPFLKPDLTEQERGALQLVLYVSCLELAVILQE